MAGAGKSREWGWLAVAVAAAGLALGLRLHAAAFIAGEDGEFAALAAGRELWHCGFGRGLWSGFALGLNLGLYPALLAAGLALGADPERSAYWIGIAASVLTLLPLSSAARQSSERKSAAAACVLFAFMPIGIEAVTRISPVPVIGLFFGLFLWASGRANLRPKVTGFILAAAMVALAALVPGQRFLLLLEAPAPPAHVGGSLLALALLPALALLGLFAGAATPERRRGDAFLLAAAAVAGVLALIFPALLYLVELPVVILAGRGLAGGPGWVVAKLGKGNNRRAVWAARLGAVGVLLLMMALGLLRAETIRAADAAVTPERQALLGRRQAGLDAGGLANSMDCARPAVCASSYLFAYYLDGLPADLPADPEQAGASLASGACSFLALDSLSVRRERPALKPLLTAASVPGGNLIFRRYLLDYNLLVSIYRSRRDATARPLRVEVPAPAPDDRAAGARLLEWAQTFGRQGFVEHERQVLAALLAAQPDNALAHREAMKVYLIYGRFDGVSLDRADDELRRYSFLAPNDPLLPTYQASIHDLRLIHQAEWGRDSK